MTSITYVCVFPRKKKQNTFFFLFNLSSQSAGWAKVTAISALVRTSINFRQIRIMSVGMGEFQDLLTAMLDDAERPEIEQLVCIITSSEHLVQQRISIGASVFGEGILKMSFIPLQSAYLFSPAFPLLYPCLIQAIGNDKKKTS